MKITRTWLALFLGIPLLISMFATAGSQAAAPQVQSAWPSLTPQLITDQVSAPVHITHAGDASGRLFIVEKSGQVRIYHNGSLLPDPFLNIQSKVRSDGGEQGLLSIAFPPEYANKGYFYVSYTRQPDGTSILARYYRDHADPDLADPASEQILLQIPQPASNHNGGQLAFGPQDGYLYVGTGDGGGGGDPYDNGQDLSVLLGKILRLDVESVAVPLAPATKPTGMPYRLYLPMLSKAEAAQPYLIPADNPFMGQDGAAPEIWALGLRNPWRFSFDRSSADLYIADVGQNAWEEINLQLADSPGGENYGWNCKEGTHDYDFTAECASKDLTDPIYEYDHNVGRSITGGFAYRGVAIPDLVGAYIYGDYINGKIWGLRMGATDWENQLLLDTSYYLSTFGEDEAGELYLADYSGGAVYRLIEDIVP